MGACGATGESRLLGTARGRSAGRVVAAAICFAGFFGFSSARAAGFDLDFFKPTTTSTGLFCEENGLTVPREQLDVGVALGYAHRPLVVENQRDAATTGDVVHDRIATTFVAGYGVTDWLDVGLRLTAVARQVGDLDVDIANNGGVPQRPNTSALGDTDLLARASLVQVDRADKRFRLTLLAPLGLPTGHPEALTGSGHFSFRPRLIAGWHWTELAVSASAGYAYTTAVEVPRSGLVVGKAVEAGLGVAYAVLPGRLWVQAEMSFSMGLELTPTGIGTAATQMLAGPRALLPGDLLIQAGLGAGLTQAAGSPRLAGLVTISRPWTFK